MKLRIEIGGDQLCLRRRSIDKATLCTCTLGANAKLGDLDHEIAADGEDLWPSLPTASGVFAATLPKYITIGSVTRRRSSWAT